MIKFSHGHTSSLTSDQVTTMDYLFRLLGLGDLEKIRFEQIHRQKTLDTQVEQKAHLCPGLISQYYLSQREISRQQQTQFIKSGLTEKIPVLRQQFLDNEKHYNDLEESLQSPDFCPTLKAKFQPPVPQPQVVEVPMPVVVVVTSVKGTNTSHIAHPH